MESVLAASSSVLSSALPPGEYEVFLSFRGPDVRNTFADHLYTSLHRSRIRTFRDEEELRKGEGIAPSLVQAIPNSKIYVPILTKQYASSKWCLQELAQMVGCWKQKKGHLILPIFYFVDPRDARHQHGSYQEAFEQHARKHSPETVNEWKEALREVGQMKGWHVTESDSQGAIIEQIVSEVELHLRGIYALVTDELVGIDSHVEEVMALLNTPSSIGKVVGIHGMGGIGKTSLSKAVYNKIFTQFDRSCFLEDVRETLTKSDGALSLQSKLISSIMKKDNHQVSNVSEGINTIKERVCNHKVLIVIDDIDDRFEFDKIIGNLGDFSFDSRFMFTTRYKRVLDFFPGCKLYEIGEMSHPLSLQLFSKHAFAMDSPPMEDVVISEEFVKVAAGLPLALKVIGSLLFRRERKFWEEKLIELQGIPSTTENKVQERLKISYNELSHNEKQIFLDIACFFIGTHKDLIYYMWSGCDFYPESGITTLIHRSLMKLDEGNHFWMHDHIKDLGRAIVREEDIQHPYNRSRIWSADDALDMFRNARGTERVEVLRVDVKSGDLEKGLKSTDFKNLSGLRYLEVQYGSIMGDFSQVLPNLCCLRLPCCASIPTDIYAKKLVVLDLKDCNVTDNWKGWNRIKAAAKLKAVNLPKCYRLRKAPDLSTCTSLELINFESCLFMEGELHIGNFKNLKRLSLCWTELPAGMENLPSLKTLLLESGKSWEFLMEEIPRLPRSIKRLTISPPSRVPNLSELTELESLSYVRGNIPCIPEDLWLLNLIKLELLVVYGCPVLVEIQGLGGLAESLSRLLIGGCPSLANYDGLQLLGALEYLTLLHGEESFPDLSGLFNLKQLKLRRCLELTELTGFERLVSLEQFTMNECNSSGLRNLKAVTIRFCDSLIDLTGIERLESLQEIVINCCHSITKLPNLSSLKNLERLDLSKCTALTEVQGVEGLESLTILRMCDCRLIKDLNLSGLRKLWQLDIEGCTKLTKVKGLEELDGLQFVDMGKRMRVKYLAKSAARYGKGLLSGSLSSW
ncbi:unnamed protein product [Linum tenue]|uniref:TIR domain-containing protein n=1 Tax=Linum tenue TaxID=586396 RepID=A0AAV0L5F2_9ROSI|nr:unnamed protein product [Linum tenue]